MKNSIFHRFINRALFPWNTIFLVSFSLLVFPGSASYARDYIRSCSAAYIVTPISIRGGNTAFLPRFQGRGKVGYYNPNEARRRASRNINECINAHWADRDSSNTPIECTESNRIYNYHFTPLSAHLRNEVCRLNKGHDRITSRVSVQKYGRTGCWGNINVPSTISSDFTVNCPSWLVEENVDRPGGNMPGSPIILSQTATYHACKLACEENSICRAWTFVSARCTNTGLPRCWLKSEVPSPQPDPCTVSGVPERM